MIVIKLIFGLLWTVICACIAFWPEFVMYKMYGVIHPVEVWEKIVTFGLFWFGGGSLCVIFFLIGGGIWLAGTTAILEHRSRW